MTTRRKSGISNGASLSVKTGQKETELRLQDDVRLAYANSRAVRLFRNNVGVLRNRGGRYVAYGLCPGSSDLIGWRTESRCCPNCGVLLDPVARFAALEIKRPGEVPTDKQFDFLGAVQLAGGLCGWADSVATALKIIEP